MSEPSASPLAAPDATPEGAATPKLQRVLGLGDLLFYGLVLLQPVGIIGLFGVGTRMSHGHMATSILIAMVAMMITAVSYGRMAALYPSAGSAYTYVGRGLNPHLGFLAGWAMVLDYLIIPIVNVTYGAISAERLLPAVPYWAWVLIIGLGMTFLNVRGIRATARANQVLMAAMVVVAVAFVIAAVRYLFQTAGWHGLVSLAPFYDPATFNFGDACTATSFAAAAYVGFDGITTLAEDAIQPKRTVPLATVLVCLVTGLTAILLAYLAQRVSPSSDRFTDVDSMFMDIAAMAGGPWLFNAIAVIMAVTCFGSGLTGQVGAARLLYSMGRDNVLPRAIFGRLDRHNAPTLNIWLIGAVALIGAFPRKYALATCLINFGAFLAFMGVNAAAIRTYWFSPPPGYRRQWLTDIVVPALGLLFCLWIWCSLPRPAQVVGAIWFVMGLLYAAVLTRGFRRRPAMLDFSES
jgi:amino acid transporter